MRIKPQKIVMVSLAAGALVIGLTFAVRAAQAPVIRALASTSTTTPGPSQEPAKPPLQTPLAPDQLRTLTRLAQCMREQGFADYPDPSPTGQLDLPEAYLQPGPDLRARLDTATALCKRRVAR
jgi:hypothetical protein